MAVFTSDVVLSRKVVLILANSAELDEMQHHAVFHPGLCCLPKYPFRGSFSLLSLGDKLVYLSLASHKHFCRCCNALASDLGVVFMNNFTNGRLWQHLQMLY